MNKAHKVSPAMARQFVELYRAGLSTVKIGQQFGIHSATINAHLKKQGVMLREGGSYSRNFSDEEEAEIAQMYRDGMSAKAIMRLKGLKFHISITGALRRQGIELRTNAEVSRLYTVNPHVFDSIDNELAAYWLGFIYADGHIHRSRTLAIKLSAKDVAHLRKLTDFLETDATVREFAQQYAGKTYQMCELSITHQHLGAQIEAHGITVPRDISKLNLANDVTHHFVRGFFDGDGSAGKKPATGINFMGSQTEMEFVRSHLAEQAGRNPNLAISKHAKSDVYYLRYSGRLTALAAADYLYRDATVWLERKRTAIESWPVPPPRVKDEKGRYT